MTSKKHEEQKVEEQEESDELIKLLDEVSDGGEPEVEEEKTELQTVAVQATEIVPPASPPPEFERSAFYSLAKKFSGVTDLVIKDAQTDRKKLDELIDHASKIVMAQDRPQAAMIEAWVNSLSKKAETNIALTKLLDSIAKLLAASKNNDIFVQVNNVGGDMDLKKLLDQPDEEM